MGSGANMDSHIGVEHRLCQVDNHYLICSQQFHIELWDFLLSLVDIYIQLDDLLDNILHSQHTDFEDSMD
jgi:hypothetical protein